MSIVQEAKRAVGEKLTSVVLGIVAPPDEYKNLIAEQNKLEASGHRHQNYILYEEVAKRSTHRFYPCAPSCAFEWVLEADPTWFFEIVGWPTTMKQLAKVHRTIQRGTFRLEQSELLKLATALAEVRKPTQRTVSRAESALREHIVSYDEYVEFYNERVRLFKEIDVSWVKTVWGIYFAELSYDRHYHYSDSASTYCAGKEAEKRVKARIEELKKENTEPDFHRFLSYF